MLLADHLIKAAIGRGDIKVTPYDVNLIQPASLEMRLDDQIVTFDNDTSMDPIDPTRPVGRYAVTEVPRDDAGFLIEPGQFILACTMERIQLGPNIAARIEGKSTLARHGLVIHSTAGFVDPGFKGQLTLEMTNLNKRPIILRPGMRIAQLSFTHIQAADRPYGSPGLGSHYQNQAGPMPAEPLN